MALVLKSMMICVSAHATAMTSPVLSYAAITEPPRSLMRPCFVSKKEPSERIMSETNPACGHPQVPEPRRPIISGRNEAFVNRPHLEGAHTDISKSQ
jgi:hypothetical protein